MAADKKKAGEKKASTKKAPKTSRLVLKKSKKKLGDPSDSLIIDVPQGGQVIRYFNLKPALATPIGPGDWIFAERGTTTDISSLTVTFPDNQSALERELERAVLVISIEQDEQAGGTWRFALGGVATDQQDEDPNNDIVLDIIDNGFGMLVYIHALQDSYESVPFGFVASFTDATTGVVSIYESQDPSVIITRPR